MWKTIITTLCVRTDAAGQSPTHKDNTWSNKIHCTLHAIKGGGKFFVKLKTTGLFHMKLKHMSFFFPFERWGLTQVFSLITFTLKLQIDDKKCGPLKYLKVNLFLSYFLIPAWDAGGAVYSVKALPPASLVFPLENFGHGFVLNKTKRIKKSKENKW